MRNIIEFIKKYRYILWVLLLVALAVENAFLIKQNREYRSALKQLRNPLEMTYKELEGKPAPTFNLKSTENELISLDEFNGQRLVLIFFTTDCPACEESAEKWEESVRKPGYEEAKVLALSPDDMEDIIIFKAVKDLQFYVCRDSEKVVFKRYGIKYVPQAVWIDEQRYVTEINPL